MKEVRRPVPTGYISAWKVGSVRVHGLTSTNDGSNQESSFPYGELWLYVYHVESRQDEDLGEAQTNHRIEQNSIHDRVSFNAQLDFVKGDVRRAL